MECACIDADVDDFVNVLSNTYPKVRKGHRCGECGRDIKKGETYRLEKMSFEGTADTAKTCIDCDSVRTHLVCSFYYGDVWELVRESFKDAPDAIPYAKIGQLTPAARDMVCEIIEDIWQDEDNGQ